MKNLRFLSLLLCFLILTSLLWVPVRAEEAGIPESTEETLPPWADDPTGYRENQLADAP